MRKKATSMGIREQSGETSEAKKPGNGIGSSENSNSGEPNNELLRRNRKIKKKNNLGKLECVLEGLDQSSNKLNLEDSAETTEISCKTHLGQKIEFLCKNKNCLLELCSFCILEHKEHILEIFSLKDLVKEKILNFELLNIPQVQNDIYQAQTKCLDEFGVLTEKLKSVLHVKINAFKDQLVSTDERLFDQLSTFKTFKKCFRPAITSQSEVSLLTGQQRFSAEGIRILKQCLQSQEKSTTNGFLIEEKIILEQFSKILTNNINFTVGGYSLNTTLPGVPKYLHWFEWEKRDLHLFDVVDYNYTVVRLIVPFRIPPFSRSIMVPSGEIFLIGGEDPELGAKREVYSFDTTSMDLDHSLHPRSPMPNKKFDFTLCYHRGFIYLICGKDADSVVVDTCERYDVARNQWASIAPINKRRYAASAVAVRETERIYLFGGRSDYHNNMMEDIEEYTISQNTWRIIRLHSPNDWTPVEVCSSIQIQPGKILIFGGSDASIEDSKQSYVFDVEGFKLEKTSPLKKPHVFVSASFMHGNHIFAVGNEYYVKNRNIHRFNIEKREWEVVF